MSEQVPTQAIEHCAICHRVDRDGRYHSGCDSKALDHHCGNCHRAKCVDTGSRITCPGCDFQGVAEDFTEYRKEAAKDSGVYDVARQCPKCSSKFDYDYGKYTPASGPKEPKP